MSSSQSSVMQALYRIADDQAEATEFVVSKTTRNLGVPLKELKLKQGILIAVIVRDDKVIIPEGSTCIQDHDSIIIVSGGQAITDVNDIFAPSFESGGRNEF